MIGIMYLSLSLWLVLSIYTSNRLERIAITMMLKQIIIMNVLNEFFFGRKDQIQILQSYRDQTKVKYTLVPICLDHTASIKLSNLACVLLTNPLNLSSVFTQTEILFR